jgi:hypothetical protein
MEPKLAVGVMVILTHSPVGMAGSIGTIIRDEGMVKKTHSEGEVHMWRVEFPRPIKAWHRKTDSWEYNKIVAAPDAHLKPVSGLPDSVRNEMTEEEGARSYLQQNAVKITQRLKDIQK